MGCGARSRNRPKNNKFLTSMMPSSPEQIFERIKQLDSSDLQFDRADDIIKLILQSSRKLSPDELSFFRWPNELQSQPQKNTPAATDKIHLIFGSGLAQSRGELADQGFSDLFILEPDPGLLCLFLAAVDPRIIFPDTRLHCYCNLDNCLRQLREEQNFWRTIKMLQLPFCVARNPEIAERLQQETKVSNAIAAEESKTIEKHYFTWAAQEYRNLEILLHCPHACSLKDIFQGVPAILVGAGPSLLEALPAIKEIHNQQNCLIVAASTALRAMETSGIIPDFAIIIEGKQQSHFEKLSNNYLERLTLLAALKTNAKHFDYNFKRVYWFHNQTSPILELVAEILPTAQPLTSSGNVINEAMQFAILAGCNPIVLSGCDLSFKDGTKYARGLEKEESNHEDDKKIFFPVAGSADEQLTAPPEFIAYAQSLENIITQQKENNQNFGVINISTGGREIKGCEIMSPESCRDLLMGVRTKKPQLSGFSAGKVISADALKRHRSKINQLNSLLSLIVGRKDRRNLVFDFSSARYLLAQLPEFRNGIAINVIPWLRRLMANQIEIDDLKKMIDYCEKVTTGEQHRADKA